MRGRSREHQESVEACARSQHAALLVTACGRRTIVIQDRHGDIAPRCERAAEVNAALAKLGGEIASPANHVTRTTGTERAEAERKFVRLRCYRDIEQVRVTDGARIY